MHNESHSNKNNATIDNLVSTIAGAVSEGRDDVYMPAADHTTAQRLLQIVQNNQAYFIRILNERVSLQSPDDYVLEMESAGNYVGLRFHKKSRTQPQQAAEYMD